MRRSRMTVGSWCRSSARLSPERAAVGAGPDVGERGPGGLASPDAGLPVERAIESQPRRIDLTDVPAEHLTRETAPRAAGAFQQCINPACSATFAVDEAHFACPACGDLIDVVYEWDRLPVPRRLSRVRGEVGRPARPARTSPASGGSASCSRSPRPSRSSPSAKARPCSRRADKVGRYVGLDPGVALAPVRGHESLRQLQRQRNDRGIHACSHGFGPAGRVREHGQHVGGAGGLLLGDRPRVPRDHLHRHRARSPTASWRRRSTTAR